MNITVKYTSQLKKETGKANEVFEIDSNDSIESILKKVMQKYNENFCNMLFEKNGRFRQSTLLVLNGVQVHINEPLCIKDGDELLLMSAIAGG